MSREYSSSTFSNGPKFVTSLYTQNQIGSRVFAFYFSIDASTQSIIELGGYSSGMIRSGASIVQLPLTSSFFWESPITGFRVGSSATLSDGTTSAYHTVAVPGIFDTGTTLIYAPTGKSI